MQMCEEAERNDREERIWCKNVRKNEDVKLKIVIKKQRRGKTNEELKITDERNDAKLRGTWRRYANEERKQKRKGGLKKAATSGYKEQQRPLS